jgi:hypothetical protein
LRPKQKEKNLPFIQNLAVFALGIVLIELCFGQAIALLRTSEDVDSAGSHSGIYADYTTATRLLKSGFVMEEAGMRYESVVRCCIHCTLDPRIRNHDLNDDDFRQAVYDYVVVQLEDELREFTRPLI